MSRSPLVGGGGGSRNPPRLLLLLLTLLLPPLPESFAFPLRRRFVLLPRRFDGSLCSSGSSDGAAAASASTVVLRDVLGLRSDSEAAAVLAEYPDLVDFGEDELRARLSALTSAFDDDDDDDDGECSLMP